MSGHSDYYAPEAPRFNAFEKEPLRLTNAEAYALAELCKRIGWEDCMRLAVDEREAQLMINVTDRLRAGLADNGWAVR